MCSYSKSGSNVADFAVSTKQCPPNRAMQLNIADFAVSTKQAAQLRQEREARQVAAIEYRRQVCATLDLPWPQKKRCVGRPSRQTQWEDAIYRALDADEEMPIGITRDVPGWWSR